MKKTYVVKINDFLVGEIGKKLVQDQEIDYDLEKGLLYLDGQVHEVRNLKACIKAEWLVPKDGDYAELDEPLGETHQEASDRKRKLRFEEMAKNNDETLKVVKDDREVGKVVGVISEDEEMFEKMLNVEPVASWKKKSYTGNPDVIEDDTKVVSTGKLFDDTETKSLKKASGQEKKAKKENKTFEVFTDHYDGETIEVGVYENTSRETTLKAWGKMHWSKKAKIISKVDDVIYLEQLKTLESSSKIKERIESRLSDLQG